MRLICFHPGIRDVALAHQFGSDGEIIHRVDVMHPKIELISYLVVGRSCACHRWNLAKLWCQALTQVCQIAHRGDDQVDLLRKRQVDQQIAIDWHLCVGRFWAGQRRSRREQQWHARGLLRRRQRKITASQQHWRQYQCQQRQQIQPNDSFHVRFHGLSISQQKLHLNQPCASLTDVSSTAIM